MSIFTSRYFILSVDILLPYNYFLSDIGNGLEEIKRALVVQSFDSGVYAIPPFLLVNGPDTVRSNGLSIKVNPVDVSEMTDINPIADVAGFESKWYDWLPDWITDYWLWIVLGIVIIAGGICAYLILSNKVNVNIMPQKKRLYFRASVSVAALQRNEKL